MVTRNWQGSMRGQHRGGTHVLGPAYGHSDLTTLGLSTVAGEELPMLMPAMAAGVQTLGAWSSS